MMYYRSIYMSDSPIATQLFQMENSSAVNSSKQASGYYVPNLLDNAKALLSQLGFGNVQARDLLSLLSPDPLDDALHIMADVRAYFQGLHCKPTCQLALT
jgi:hypothetical protein